jgi:hypothetical protein
LAAWCVRDFDLVDAVNRTADACGGPDASAITCSALCCCMSANNALMHSCALDCWSWHLPCKLAACFHATSRLCSERYAPASHPWSTHASPRPLQYIHPS